MKQIPVSQAAAYAQYVTLTLILWAEYPYLQCRIVNYTLEMDKEIGGSLYLLLLSNGDEYASVMFIIAEKISASVCIVVLKKKKLTRDLQCSI